jgi:TPR repeat protein
MADELALQRIDQPAETSMLTTRAHSNLIERGRRDFLNLASEALFARGETFLSADGVPQDYAEAIVWFRRAAERYNVKAMVRLGLMHYMGWGAPQDDAASFGWYQKAAEAGCAVGQFWLGYCYRNGIGTKRDDAQAIIWDLRSAEQGYAKAQSWLGSVYLGYGERFGVPRDPQESYFWSYLAHELYTAENRSVLAKSATQKRDKAAFSLTDAALAQTQDRAKQWLAAHRIKTSD